MKYASRLGAILVLLFVGGSMVAHNPETHAGDIGVILFIIALIGLVDLALS